MCGLACVLRLDGEPLAPEHRDTLRQMTETLRHRGPDSWDVWDSGPIGMGHCLLRINGDQAQPIVRYYGETTKALVMVGEIYQPEPRNGNDVSLAFDLLAEASAPSYALRRMNGMFGLAFWDGEKLILARDRFGEKPLFVMERDGLLLAASEIKALAKAYALRADEAALIERERLHLFLGSQTAFLGVRRVEPGTFLVYAPGPARQPAHRWYSLPHDDVGESQGWGLAGLLSSSIDLRARPDVRAACALSGGLDSSIVASVSGLEAWHGSFAEESFSETRYARMVARHAFWDVRIGPEDFEREIHGVVAALDEPIAGPGAFAEWMVAKRASEEGVRVMLGGYGGDEVWGGYARQRMIHAAPPGYEPLERIAYGAMVCREPGCVADLGEQYAGASPLGRACRWETTATLRALLEVSDRVSAAHAIETRAPLLDPRIVDAAFRGGDEVRLGKRPKGALANAAEQLGVPQAIIGRRDKMGFPVPLALWARGPLRSFIGEILGRDPHGMGTREIWGELLLRLWAERWGYHVAEEQAA